jgi:hypothetical protein
VGCGMGADTAAGCGMGADTVAGCGMDAGDTAARCGMTGGCRLLESSVCKLLEVLFVRGVGVDVEVEVEKDVVDMAGVVGSLGGVDSVGAVVVVVVVVVVFAGSSEEDVISVLAPVGQYISTTHKREDKEVGKEVRGEKRSEELLFLY